jgi:hypothetical protein
MIIRGSPVVFASYKRNTALPERERVCEGGPNGITEEERTWLGEAGGKTIVVSHNWSVSVFPPLCRDAKIPLVPSIMNFKLSLSPL